MRLLTAAILVLLLAGCGVSVRSSPTPSSPIPGAQTFYAPGNYMTTVIPVTMQDGTRCVIAIGNSPGRGIDCDFKGTR